MQQAPVPEVGAATELNCQFCGWPLIKDGELMCNRSSTKGHRHTVKATLGEKRIFCPFCRKPKVTLAKNDRAICPKCEKGKKEGTPMTIGQEVHSKTKELQDWLDREISKIENNISILQSAIKAFETHGFGAAVFGKAMRYVDLTYDELEAKVVQDRKKLEEYKRQIELLESAREFNIDVEKMERAMGVVVEIRKYDAPALEWKKQYIPERETEFSLSLGSRNFWMSSGCISCRLEGIERVEITEASFNRDLAWMYIYFQNGVRVYFDKTSMSIK